MERRIIGRAGRTPTKRAFCAYLVLVLLMAISGPALVFAAEGEAEAPSVPAEAHETGDLVVRTFEDCDRDGVWDEGEPASGGWSIRVCDESGCEIGSGTTDSNGWLSLQGLAAGRLVVVLTLQAGWNNTTPLSQTLVLGAGETARACFGVVRCVEAPQTGQLIVRKFEDLNEDGLWGIGEPALEGWHFTLYNDSDVEIASGTTDANGWLLFDGLAAGEVTVTETLQAGWDNTTPLSQTASIVAGSAARLCFGNVRSVEAPETGGVRIHKFGDDNENGVLDAGEQLLPGWSFVVRDSGGAVVASGVTDASGMLDLELPVGPYTVTETLVAGWTNTTAITQNLTVVAGQTVHLYFGNTESFLPFTPQPTPVVSRSAAATPGDPFLPFTGGEYLALLAAALASGIAGATLRRRPRETA